MSRWEAEGRLADVRADIARFEAYAARPEVTLVALGAYMFGRTHIARAKGLSMSIPCDAEGIVQGPTPRHATEVARILYAERLDALRANEKRLEALVESLGGRPQPVQDSQQAVR
jgi:hypothetical protein